MQDNLVLPNIAYALHGSQKINQKQNTSSPIDFFPLGRRLLLQKLTLGEKQKRLKIHQK